MAQFQNADLRAPRIILSAESEHPVFILRPEGPLQQRIRSASASQETCEAGDALVDIDLQCLMRVSIDNGQGAQSATVEQCIRNGPQVTHAGR
jgi:hypothetical protein